MIKIISKMIWCVVLGTLLSPKAYSVVPYPPSVEGESALNQEDVSDSTSPRSVSQVADKLAIDQLRLERVLQDLKADQKALQQTDTKENQDGHSLH